MKATFSVDQLIQAVVVLSQERPKMVYQGIHLSGCYYTKSACSTTDGCILGQALLRLQPELRPMLEEWDNRSSGASGIQFLLKELGIEFSDKVAWCCRVQGSQDREAEWGWAVSTAGDFT